MNKWRILYLQYYTDFDGLYSFCVIWGGRLFISKFWMSCSSVEANKARLGGFATAFFNEINKLFRQTKADLGMYTCKQLVLHLFLAILPVSVKSALEGDSLGASPTIDGHWWPRPGHGSCRWSSPVKHLMEQSGAWWEHDRCITQWLVNQSHPPLPMLHVQAHTEGFCLVAKISPMLHCSHAIRILFTELTSEHIIILWLLHSARTAQLIPKYSMKWGKTCYSHANKQLVYLLPLQRLILKIRSEMKWMI